MGDTNKRSLNPRSLFMLLLLAVALVGLGVFLYGKPDAGVELTRAVVIPKLGNKSVNIVVRNVKLATLSPREVADGYDTKMVVTMDISMSVPPKTDPSYTLNVRDLRVFSTKAGKVQSLKLPPDVPEIRAEVDSANVGRPRREVTLLLPRARWPVIDSETLLKANVDFYQPALVTSVLEMVVRKPNERIRAPQIPHDSPLSIQKVEVSGNTKVHIKLNYQTPPEAKPSYAPEMKFGDTYIVDERGKKYRIFENSSYGPNYTTEKRAGWTSKIAEQQIYEDAEAIAPEEIVDRKHFVTFAFADGLIPPSAGQLTLKSSVSADDTWPVPISVIVRPKKPPSPLKVVGIKVRKLPQVREWEANTEVIVDLQYSGPTPPAKPLPLIWDWGQRMVYEEDLKVWAAGGGKTGARLPTPITIPVYKYDSKRGIYTARYRLTVPRDVLVYGGNVTFKTEIGVDGHKPFPLSVVVHKSKGNASLTKDLTLPRQFGANSPLMQPGAPEPPGVPGAPGAGGPPAPAAPIFPTGPISPIGPSAYPRPPGFD